MNDDNLAMNLTHLPPEVLCQVLDCYCISSEVLALWASGNRALISKLANGGVRSVTLTSYSLHKSARWPLALAHFQLEMLDIKTDSTSLGSIETIRCELKKLSPHLRRLHLTMPNVTEILFGASKENTPVPDDDETRHPKRSKQLQDTVNEELRHESLWNLDLTWPNLEELQVSSHLKEAPVNYRLFALLPRSLLKLSITSRFQPQDNHHLDTLPPNLQSLHLGTPLIANDVPRLPRSLTDLGDLPLLDEAAEWALVTRHKLFPNLISLPDIDPDRFLAWQVESSDRTWPDTIKELTFDAPSVKLLERGLPLPRNLTSLAFGAFDEDSLDAKWLREVQLPEHLVQLDLPYVNWDGIDSSIWPPTLRTLNFNDDPIELANFHQLPRSITECHMMIDTATWTEKDLDLKSLLALGRSALTLDDSLWQNTKAQLIERRQRLNTTRDTFVETYIDRIENGHLFGLPLSLTQLRLQNLGAHVEYTAHAGLVMLLLPPLLTVVDLPGGFTAHPSFLPLFPPDATALTTSFPLYENRSSIKDPTSTTLYKLTQLRQIKIRTDRKAASRALLCLPPDLNALTFYCIESRITTSILERLPPRLTRLEMRGEIPRWKPWLHLIPRSVTHLSMPHYLDGSDFCNLPPNLTSLEVRLRNVRLQDFWTHPKSLQSIASVSTWPFDEHPSPHALWSAGFLDSRDLDFLLNRFRTNAFLFRGWKESFESIESALKHNRSRRHYAPDREDEDTVSDNDGD